MEGAVHEDGRGPSIWDVFSHAPGKVRAGDTGDVACDHYHRFESDVALLAELGIQAYRFSVAWPRVQAQGRGPADQRGLDYYRRLVDALNRHGIEPLLTLYHWDLPQALQDDGGWVNRDTAGRFADYAALVHDALGTEVRLWATLNEPWCAAWLGYGDGIHAPGHRDDAEALAATHHLLLAHGFAVDAMGRSGGDVGIVLNLQPTEPASDDPADVRAATLADLQMNALYLDPIFGRGYPADLMDHYASAVDPELVRDGDLEAIARPLDFLGVNYYTVQTVAADPRRWPRAMAMPGHRGAWTFVPDGVPATAMSWAVRPDAYRDMLLRLHREYPSVPLYLTENGAAFDDVVDDHGRVDDQDRIGFLRDHIGAAQEALEAGVPLRGYFVWSFLDNFEWAQGYAKRFGIVYVDYPTQRRIPKASARWYGEVIAAGGPSPPVDDP